MKLTKHHFLPILAVPVVILVIDRFLKIDVERFSLERFPIIPRVIEFAFFANRGIAFSIPFSGPLLWILSATIIGIFSFFAFRHHEPKNRLFLIFFYLLFIFGAISNLYDRVALGYTVDYLIFFERSAVNLADGMIIVGAGALIWNMKMSKK